VNGHEGAEVVASDRGLKRGTYECFILAVSLLSIANLVLMFTLPLPETREVIRVCDIVLSAILLLDFGFRLVIAPSRRDYLLRQHGWLDFVGSLPFPGVRLFRLLRVVRVLRLLRDAGLRRLRRAVLRDRSGSTLLGVSFVTVVLIEVASALVLSIEARADDSNIHTPSDALWWTYVTIATVGFGDRYPVTDPGRVVGVITMTVGVVLFGTLTAFLADRFLRPRASEGTDHAELRAELAASRRQIEDLAREVGELGPLRRSQRRIWRARRRPRPRVL
jgi:voltage-gated potassium channel